MPHWWKWNPTTHIFEISLNEGTSWAPPALNASIINEGVMDPARLPPATPVPPNIAFTNVDNIWTATQSKLPSQSGISGPNCVFWFREVNAGPEPRWWRTVQYADGNLYWERFRGNDGIYMGAGPAFLADGGLSANGPLVGTTLTASQGIISFPAAQNPSGSPNHLDDYEEGSWTPYWSGSGAPTGSSGTGRYIKTGRQVWVGGRLSITGPGTYSGLATMGGFPFLCDSYSYAAVSISHFAGAGAGFAYMAGLLYPAAAYCDIRVTTGAVTAVSTLTAAQMVSFDIIFGCNYIANQ